MSDNQAQDDGGNNNGNGDGKSVWKIILTILLVIVGITILGLLIWYLIAKYGSSSAATLTPKTPSKSKESGPKEESGKTAAKEKDSALRDIPAEPLKPGVADSVSYSAFHPESNVAPKEEKSEKKKKGAKSALHEGFDLKSDLFGQKEVYQPGMV